VVTVAKWSAGVLATPDDAICPLVGQLLMLRGGCRVEMMRE